MCLPKGDIVSLHPCFTWNFLIIHTNLLDVGQRRREKIAALEAQAQGNTSPQPSHGHNAGGVQLPLGSMSSTSASPPTDSTDIEEIMRNTEDVGFPTMDFGNQDPLNMQLFEDFSKCSLLY